MDAWQVHNSQFLLTVLRAYVEDLENAGKEHGFDGEPYWKLLKKFMSCHASNENFPFVLRMAARQLASDLGPHGAPVRAIGTE